MLLMTTRTKEAAVPCSCPRCNKGGGQPFRLAPDAALVRVLLQCDWCKHRWSTIVAPDDALVTNNSQLWSKNSC